MQKPCVSIAMACLCLATFVFLPGCGESLFKGLDGSTAARTAQEANDRGDYIGAISFSQAIIDNPNASTEEKQDAYAQKGIALLAVHDISLLSLTSLLEGTAEENIVDALSNLFEISPSDSAEIAETFNMAYTLGGGDLGLSSLSAAQLFATSASSLDTNKQLLRGMANLSVVVKMTTRVFVIDTEGTVTKTDEVETYEDAMHYLMGGSRTVFYYAENAIDGFTASNAFTDYQLTQAQKLRIVGLNVKNLYTAIENNATFTLQNYVNGTAATVTGDHAYSVAIPASGDDRETNIKAALDTIFTYIKTN